MQKNGPKTAIILHGTLGSPHGNWFQWLRAQLEQAGITVWLPQLPHPEQPSLQEWGAYVRHECPFPITDATIIIGHSSGAILALILAQHNPQPVGSVVAVSVFHDNSLEWEPNNRLFDVEFDWNAIGRNAQKLLFVHSDDDPYVPLPQAQFVAKQTGGEMAVIPGEGHFNLEKSPDYETFPKLLELLKEKGIL